MQEARKEIKSVRDADVKGKRVLVRVNFDVPMREGNIFDDTRIKSSLPTIELLHEHGAKDIILLTHVGRPRGKVVEDFRVAPMETRLRELTQIPFAIEENLRFNAGEESNDPAFAKKLANFGDIFVNDAFSMSHRTQASVVGIPKLLPSYAGLRFEEEIKKLSAALTPPKGAIAIIGGAKFETKEPLLKKLAAAYSALLLGGALANNLLKARGSPTGASLTSLVPVPEELAGNERILTPVDGAFMDSTTNIGRTSVINDIRANERMLDIGPETAKQWSAKIAQASFVLWNGPVGVYEEGYVEGTNALAQAIVEATSSAVIGGGDTAAALAKFSFDPAQVFISTGGGAMLEFLANGTLPGIEALKNSSS